MFELFDQEQRTAGYLQGMDRFLGEPRRPGDALDEVQCSETFRGVNPDLPHRRRAPEHLKLALELGDRPGDLGGAAILYRCAFSASRRASSSGRVAITRIHCP
jgi:hypothetical protein